MTSAPDQTSIAAHLVRKCDQFDSTDLRLTMQALISAARGWSSDLSRNILNLALLVDQNDESQMLDALRDIGKWVGVDVSLNNYDEDAEYCDFSLGGCGAQLTEGNIGLCDSCQADADPAALAEQRRLLS